MRVSVVSFVVAILAFAVAFALAALIDRYVLPHRSVAPFEIALLFLLPLPGLLLGFAIGAFQRSDPDGRGISPMLAVACLLSIALFGALLVTGVHNRTVLPIPAALTMLSGVLTLLAGTYALDNVRRGEGVAFETHWGGLGGGLGGIRVSAAAVLVVLLLVLTSATLLVAVANPADISKALLAPPAPAAESSGNTPADKPVPAAGAAAESATPSGTARPPKATAPANAVTGAK